MDDTDEPGNPHATTAENERFAAFSAHLAAEGFSPATRACYASDWWNVSERAHRDTRRRFRLDRFGADDFLLQRSALFAAGVAPATLNRRLAFLRRYSAFRAQSEPALREIAADLAEVPFQAVLRRTTRALTHAQEERIRAAADSAGPLESALLALLLGTGLRASEAAGLTRADVGTERGDPATVRVRGARGKLVVLPPRSRTRLAALLRAAPGAPEDPVFRARSGGALGEDGVASAVERAARASGVDATPRTLRHTFAVRYLSEHRDDIEGLARALGQSSLAGARAYRHEVDAGVPGVRVVRWDSIDAGAPAPGIRRRAFSGARIESERALMRPGASTAPHAHPEEQVTFVLTGRVSVTSGRTSLFAAAGEFVIVPGGETHAIRAEDGRPALVLHVYSPPRRSRDGAGG
jgi:integrase/quercetin dioxygenase-like cupin family protein